MERIQLFKFNKISFRFLLGAAIFFLLFGIGDFVIAIIGGFEFEFPGDWRSVLFIIQGIIYCIWAYDVRRKTRFFIECNEKEFKYLIPKSKTLKCVAIADMEELKMDGIDIRFLAKEKEHHIRLEHIEWKELNLVKALITDLSLRTSHNNA
ncbi:hypothetical protein ACXR6G_17850 [Ancylomarina sp. YFZ004]